MDKKDFTNEELVKLIQDGQTEYIPQLWDQVHKFICSMAKKRLIGKAGHLWQLEEDMINESYFDFLMAVEGYKPDREGSFITYLSYSIKNSFNRVLGLRTMKDKMDPIRHAKSLDAPVEGTEDLALQDMIIDNLSEEDYRFIENDDFWQDVHELLLRAIELKTTGQTREILTIMLDGNYNLPEAITVYGIPKEKRHSTSVLCASGFGRIRRYLRFKAVKECKELGIDEYITLGLRGSGLSAYRRNGFSSSTELAALRLVDGEAWYRKIVELMG